MVAEAENKIDHKGSKQPGNAANKCVPNGGKWNKEDTVGHAVQREEQRRATYDAHCIDGKRSKLDTGRWNHNLEGRDYSINIIIQVKYSVCS